MKEQNIPLSHIGMIEVDCIFHFEKKKKKGLEKLNFHFYYETLLFHH